MTYVIFFMALATVVICAAVLYSAIADYLYAGKLLRSLDDK